jgi:hypothetical protein
VVNTSPVGLARFRTLRHTGRLIEAVKHYPSGSDQRGTLREAAGVVTDRLRRHGSSL